MSQEITATEVEKVLPLKTWWAMLAVLPMARRLTVLIVNRTGITPNAITIASILLRVAAAASFYFAGRTWLFVGALAFYFAYLLDCIDGAVARLRKQSSEFGRFLDHVGDLVGGLLLVIALASGQHMLFTSLVAGIMFCHVAEYYISYLTSTYLSDRARSGTPQEKPGRGAMGMYSLYRSFFHSRNIKSFLSFPDYEAVIFFVFPLMGMPVYGLKIGFCMVLIITLYTILSTFAAIHTGDGKFP